MALANYSDLQAAAASYMKRSSLTDVADRINLAENRMVKGFGRQGDILYTPPLRVKEMEASGTLSTTEDVDTLALPSGFRGFRSALYISGNPRYPLEYRSSAQMVAEDTGTQSARPTSYTIEGGNIRFNVPPDAVYSIPALYWKLVPLATTSTNDTLTNHPDVFLYCTLLEAAIWLNHDADQARFANLARGAIWAANGADSENRYSGGTLTVRTDTGNP